MTDPKPLSAEEPYRCPCGHVRKDHPYGTRCAVAMCGCLGFVEPGEPMHEQATIAALTEELAQLRIERDEWKAACINNAEVVEAKEADIERLAEENRALRAALEAHGVHAYECNANRAAWELDRVCNCGLSEALARRTEEAPA